MERWCVAKAVPPQTMKHPVNIEQNSFLNIGPPLRFA
jgi:hypothetical protein